VNNKLHDPTALRPWGQSVWYTGLEFVDMNKRICVFSCTVNLDIIKVLYLPTDAQENCFKKSCFKINFNILLKQFYCASVGK
jgi:hypothetical protein